MSTNEIHIEKILIFRFRYNIIKKINKGDIIMNKKIIKEYTLRLFDDGSAQIIPNIRWLDRNDESNNIIIGENISKSLLRIMLIIKITRKIYEANKDLSMDECIIGAIHRIQKILDMTYTSVISNFDRKLSEVENREITYRDIKEYIRTIVKHKDIELLRSILYKLAPKSNVLNNKDAIEKFTQYYDDVEIIINGAKI